MSKPLLIISDAPTAPTGLGRICRELAVRISAGMGEEFRVATFGYGGTHSNKFSFPQYPMTHVNNYVATELPKVWNDFAGEEKGIILTIWNPSWTWWLANPEKLPDSLLKDFLLQRPFELWGYFPVDGDGPNGKLPSGIGDIIGRYDRVLAYTKYGAEVIEKTCPMLKPVEHLPHGIDGNVFFPRDRVEARRTFVGMIAQRPPAQLSSDLFLVGVVATNTPRKDWYLAFEACARMKQVGVKVGMWAHTDAWRKHWDLEALCEEFGMQDRVMFTNHEISDEDLAWAYSACDVTFGIGSGEGWGYPLAESLACGTPVIHGDYAGGAEFVPRGTLVTSVGFRGDGIGCIRRPVFDANSWAHKAAAAWAIHGAAKLPDYIKWVNAWPRWRQWLKVGIAYAE